MAVCTDKCVFYHVAKTGGIWVKEAIRSSGLRYGRCRDRRVAHPFGLKREHATPNVVMDEFKAGRFSFCFVRHPIGWLKSFWCYRVKTGHLDMGFPLDRIWDDAFEPFIWNVLEKYPDGFVTQLYQFYVGPDVNEVDFIGRQENLADDLVKALTLAGETFDESRLRATRWRNASARHKKYGLLCVLDEGIEQAVLDADKWVMEKFY